MEWINHMNLKKSLFTMAFVSIAVATLFSVISIWVLAEIRTQIYSQDMEIIYSGRDTIVNNVNQPSQGDYLVKLFSALQIVLPIIFFVTALLATVFLFYRWKLKAPLEILMDGANHISDNDLNFRVEAQSTDELGQLCTAFETMRQALLKNNQDLWRQAEERKRLNAAFSHDLRNPVTVLKGSAKMARQCVESETGRTSQLIENIIRIETYTARIEQYVEAMSNVGRLEQIQLEKAFTDPKILAHELENAMCFLVTDSGKQLSFTSAETTGKILLDKNVLFQIAENLVSNAIRYAKQTISVNLSFSGDMLILEVTDDGSGFTAGLLKNGIRPFQKGNEDAEHLGMGLYICDLLCQKHGGYIEIKNWQQGALVCAALKIL